MTGCMLQTAFLFCGAWVCLAVRRRAHSKRDAHHGGIPAPCLLCGMGSHLPAVSCRGLYFPEKQNKSKSEEPDPDRDVRGVYLCDLIAEDPVRHRELLPYDGDRAWSDPVRAGGCQRAGDHCADLPGCAAGARRADHAGGKYVRFPWQWQDPLRRSASISCAGN